MKNIIQSFFSKENKKTTSKISVNNLDDFKYLNEAKNIFILFQKYDENLTINDFKMFISIISDVSIDKAQASNLIKNGACKLDSKGNVIMASKGLELQSSMKLDVKPMKKIKIAGEAAQSLIDDMLSTIK